jgi:hypothetical protein
MSGSAGLERRYRRLLAWYPRAFRREYGEELLAVLMACADEGQQRPRLGEATDLIRSAIWMRLRPRVPASHPTVLWGVRMMSVCAVLRLLGVPLLPAGPGNAYPLEIGISWGMFALFAWASGRAHNWGRVLFAVWFGLHSVVLFYDIAHVSASSAPVRTVIASVVFWLVELSAVVLLFSKQSGTYYQHKAART